MIPKTLIATYGHTEVRRLNGKVIKIVKSTILKFPIPFTIERMLLWKGPEPRQNGHDSDYIVWHH